MPVVTEVTTPVLFTVATDVLLLLQVPPATDALSELLLPRHMLSTPLMVAVAEFTVTVRVPMQPDAVV